MVFLAAALLLAAASVSAHPHTGRAIANGAWYQERDHPVTSLFARAPGGPEIGSPQWLAQYPSLVDKPSQAEADIPAEWLAAYKAVKAAGKIPNIPIAVQTDNLPTYGGQDLMSKEICSSAGKCRAPGDIWDAPDGMIGYSFDDGPWRGTDKLLDFLESTNTTVTHYLIGRNIAQFPQQALRAFNHGHELAVHTWTHPKMTSETDLGIVNELGWTMQIIHDISGGRVPKYWRPPTGDMDNRVRAIAKEVFGLTPVLWNYDTEDWSLGDPKPVYTPQQMSDLIQKWVSGPKSPGLIILEHELYPLNIDIWINSTFAGAKQYGWKASPIGPMLGLPMYQNADDNTSPVTEQDNMAIADPQGAGGGAGGSSTSTPTSGSSGNSTPSGTKPTSSSNSSGASPSSTPSGGAMRHVASVSSAAVAALLAAAFL